MTTLENWGHMKVGFATQAITITALELKMFLRDGQAIITFSSLGLRLKYEGRVKAAFV